MKTLYKIFIVNGIEILVFKIQKLVEPIYFYLNETIISFK